MAKVVLVAAVLLLCASATAVNGADSRDAGSSGQSPTRWIVQLRPGASVSDVASSARSRWGSVAGQRFSSVLHGFAIGLSQTQRDALAADPRVQAVVPDVPVHSMGTPYPLTPDEVQPGARRVHALDNSDRSPANLDVDIAVLDTGIQPDNAELNISGGYDCTRPDDADPSDPANWADSAGFGHGTHVSGIAAGIENGRGVAGVAQGARLWAIKVLDGNGNGYWSSVICGLDHVAQMRDPNNAAIPQIEVVNMSLAGPGWDDGDCGYSNTDLLHQAVCRLADAGVTMVAAAGNESSDASGFVPGAYDEVITVAAMADYDGAAGGTATPPDGCTNTTADDSFATFSNYGSDVDLIAPGVCVLSTLPVDRLGMMSGTSMATPQVSGGAALYYLEEARLGRPRPTPPQVRAALIAAGAHDWNASSDPASRSEPALDVSDTAFAAIPTKFAINATRQIVRAAAGTQANDAVSIARTGGFADAVTLDVDSSSLPAGTQASFDTNPSVNQATEPTLSLEIPADAAAGAYVVNLTGTSGGETEHASFELVVFDSSADGGGPRVRLKSGVQASGVALADTIYWPAVANASRYELQESVDESAWATIAKTYSAKFDATAWPGRRYQYRVRAKVGRVWRPYLTGPSVVATAYEPSRSAIDFTGTWTSAPSNNTYSELPMYSSSRGATATFAFTGSSIAWVAVRGPDRGKASVSVDGAAPITLDLYASTKQFRSVVFATSFGGAASHTLRITVPGRPSGRPRVDLDTLVVVAN